MDSLVSIVRAFWWYVSETIKTIALGLFLYLVSWADRIPWPLTVLGAVLCLGLGYYGQRRRTKYLKWVHAEDPAGNK